MFLDQRDSTHLAAESCGEELSAFDSGTIFFHNGTCYISLALELLNVNEKFL